MARKRVQEERKKQILQALDACLQEKSFQKTSIKDIAKVAQVNHGVLHYYFTSKEDILLQYIDYVIEDYQDQLKQWLEQRDMVRVASRDFIEEIFGFINNRITLNKGISRIFVEIWEISLYNDAVREKLKKAYRQWIGELEMNISQYCREKNFPRNVSIAMVAFWEGMALFSTVFDSSELAIEEVLRGFQKRILELL